MMISPVTIRRKKMKEIERRDGEFDIDRIDWNIPVIICNEDIHSDVTRGPIPSIWRKTINKQMTLHLSILSLRSFTWVWSMNWWRRIFSLQNVTGQWLPKRLYSMTRLYSRLEWKENSTHYITRYNVIFPIALFLYFLPWYFVLELKIRFCILK